MPPSLGIALGLPRSHLRKGGPAPSLTLLYDSFTDTPGTAITSHTPDTVNSPASGSWAVYKVSGAPTFAINAAGNAVAKTAGTASNLGGVAFDCGVSDCIVAISSLATGRMLTLRNSATVGGTFWGVYRDGDTLYLYEYVGGANALRGTYAGTAGTWAVAVIAAGETIDVYLNGTLRITYALAATEKTSTRHGVRVFSSTNPIDVSTDFYVINSTDPADIPV